MEYNNEYLKKKLTIGEEVSSAIWGPPSVDDQWNGGQKTKNAILPWLSMSTFGQSYSPIELSIKDRELITLCALAAMGLEPQTIYHFVGAKNNGWTQLEVRDALLVNMFTSGAPKTMNSYGVICKVLDDMNIEYETRDSVRNECEGHEDIYERGLAKAKAFLGEAFEDFIAPFRAFDENVAKHVITDSFGMIFAKVIISDRLKALILIGNCTVMGNLKFLRLFLTAAIANGATKTEIKATIYQMTAYCGWPAVGGAMEVYTEWNNQTAL